MGLLLGTPLKSHRTVLDHTYHFPSLFPSISLSLGILGCIDPRKGCPSYYGKKGLKAQRYCCWVKDESLYIKLSNASPKESPKKAMKRLSVRKWGPTRIMIKECLKG
jgi:hypothetical protein